MRNYSHKQEVYRRNRALRGAAKTGIYHKIKAILKRNPECILNICTNATPKNTSIVVLGKILFWKMNVNKNYIVIIPTLAMDSDNTKSGYTA